MPNEIDSLIDEMMAEQRAIANEPGTRDTLMFPWSDPGSAAAPTQAPPPQSPPQDQQESPFDFHPEPPAAAATPLDPQPQNPAPLSEVQPLETPDAVDAEPGPEFVIPQSAEQPEPDSFSPPEEQDSQTAPPPEPKQLDQPDETPEFPLPPPAPSSDQQPMESPPASGTEPESWQLPQAGARPEPEFEDLLRGNSEEALEQLDQSIREATSEMQGYLTQQIRSTYSDLEMLMDRRFAL